MTWTKAQIIDQAFEEIGLGPYAYQKQPEDYQSARRMLDALLSEWAGKGAMTGYSEQASAYPDGDDLNTESGIEPQYIRGVYCQLAIDIAPSYGKQAPPKTAKAAGEGFSLALRNAQAIKSRTRDSFYTPAGAGRQTRQVQIPSEVTE